MKRSAPCLGTATASLLMHCVLAVWRRHSLGGAVAQLCTLHLLQALPREEHASVACISFAAPALGNQALASLAVECGWDQRMRNYLMPGGEAEG